LCQRLLGRMYVWFRLDEILLYPSVSELVTCKWTYHE
jgi:hypothetical protein